MTILWPRAVVAFVLGTASVGLLAGIPTDVLPNDWYTRMTPVQGYAVPVWGTVSILSGVLAASLWGVCAAACPARAGRALGGAGATLSWLAALSVGLLLTSIGWRWRALRVASSTSLDDPSVAHAPS